MNTYRSVMVGFGFASLVGCSTSTSPFGADPDFASIESRFRSPTGTFDQSGAGSSIEAYNQQKTTVDTNAGAISGPTGSTIGTKSAQIQARRLALRSVRMLGLDGEDDDANDEACADLKARKYSGNCACPGGGSYDYDFESARALEGYKSGPIDAIFRFKFNACAQPEAALDGSMFMSLHASGATKSDSKSGLGEFRLILAAHLNARALGETRALDFTMLVEEDRFWLSLGVDDGNIVIGTSADWRSADNTGTIVVRDRQRTFTCVLSSGAGTCTGDDGTTFKVGSSHASSEASPSDLPAGE